MGLRNLELAISWCDYLSKHAHAFYSSSSNGKEIKAAKVIAEKIVQGKLVDGDSPRDIYRKCWKGADSATLVTEALEKLAEKNWIRIEKTLHASTKGRDVIRINPGLEV